MVHESPCPGAAVVIHHDHEGDGDAANHIERKQSLHPCGNRRRNGCGDGGGGSYRIIHGNSAPPLNERWLHPTLRGSGGFRQVQSRLVITLSKSRRPCDSPADTATLPLSGNSNKFALKLLEAMRARV